MQCILTFSIRNSNFISCCSVVSNPSCAVYQSLNQWQYGNCWAKLHSGQYCTCSSKRKVTFQRTVFTPSPNAVTPMTCKKTSHTYYLNNLHRSSYWALNSKKGNLQALSNLPVNHRDERNLIPLSLSHYNTYTSSVCNSQTSVVHSPNYLLSLEGFHETVSLLG